MNHVPRVNGVGRRGAYVFRRSTHSVEAVDKMTTRDSIDRLLEMPHSDRPAVLEQIKAAFVVILNETDELKKRIERLERQLEIEA